MQHKWLSTFELRNINKLLVIYLKQSHEYIMPYESHSNITLVEIMKVYLTKPPRSRTYNKLILDFVFELELW